MNEMCEDSEREKKKVKGLLIKLNRFKYKCMPFFVFA